MTADQYNCLVVLGATATGKTALACSLASALGGEIISADSRQVYRGLDLGTGKDLGEYTKGGHQVPYHLIDVISPWEQFYLHDFAGGLLKSFESISSRERLPVICGGTGLYLDALRKPFEFTAVPEDEALRQELENLNPDALLARLEAYPRELTRHVDTASRKRVVRGIEVARYLSAHQLAPPAPLPYRPFYIGIQSTADQRSALIKERLDKRMAQGLPEEVERLLSAGVPAERLEKFGLEYKFLLWFLQGKLTEEEMRSKLCTAIMQYSKRQVTWFRKMEKEGVKIHWFPYPAQHAEVLASLRNIF